MIKEKRIIIWEDKKTNERIIMIITLISIIFLSIISFTLLSGLQKIYFIIFSGLIYLWALWGQLIRKLTVIFSEGILVGNISLKRWHSIIPKKRYFINWKDIISIRILDREVKVSRGSWSRTFIIVKDKKGKRYECVIYDPKRFILILKKLNKYNLLEDSSKYK